MKTAMLLNFCFGTIKARQALEIVVLVECVVLWASAARRVLRSSGNVLTGKAQNKESAITAAAAEYPFAVARGPQRRVARHRSWERRNSGNPHIQPTGEQTAGFRAGSIQVVLSNAKTRTVPRQPPGAYNRRTGRRTLFSVTW